MIVEPVLGKTPRYWHFLAVSADCYTRLSPVLGLIP